MAASNAKRVRSTAETSPEGVLPTTFKQPFFVMRAVRWICLAFGLIVLSLSPALGQPAPNPEVNYWVHGGPAATTLGVGASGGVAVEYNRHVFSLRGVSTDPSIGGETWDLALLYGRATTTEHMFLSAGTGVSVIGGTRYPRLFGGGEGESFDPMIGFPLEGQIVWPPSSTVSLGLYAFANVNTAHPLGGLSLFVRVGSL